MEHSHWTLSISTLDHVFQFTNGGKLCAFSWLVKLDHACKETPEHLGNKMVMILSLRNQDLLQVEQKLLSLLVASELEADLGIIKEISAVFNGDATILCLLKSLKVEFLILSHLRNFIAIRKECHQLVCFLLSSLV